jgi:hypothetical protein
MVKGNCTSLYEHITKVNHGPGVADSGKNRGSKSHHGKVMVNVQESNSFYSYYLFRTMLEFLLALALASFMIIFGIREINMDKVLLTPHFSFVNCHSSLLTHHPSPLPHPSQFTSHPSPSSPHSSLWTPRFSFLIAHSSLPTHHSLLLTPHSSLFTPHSLFLTPHSLLIT